MPEIVFKTVTIEFTLDGVAGAAHAGAVRTAALDHEAADHAVEDESVVEALFDKADKIVDCVGSAGGIKLSFDDAAVLHLDGDNWILFHLKKSFL